MESARTATVMNQTDATAVADTRDTTVRQSAAVLEATTASSNDNEQTPILLLNGFGVGSFHQHRLIHEMLGDETHTDRPMYGIDYLGQGRFVVEERCRAQVTFVQW